MRWYYCVQESDEELRTRRSRADKITDGEMAVFEEWDRLFMRDSEVDDENKARALTNIILIYDGPYDRAEMLRRRVAEMRIQLQEWRERREIRFSDERE